MDDRQERDSHPGQRLATLQRKDGAEEFRVELREFKGHTYVDLRVWWQNEQEEWRPGKGTTVKIHELGKVRDAISEAIKLTAHQNGQRAPAR